MSLTLQKLNQIRKKVKEREVLQSGNYYDLKDAEMSSLHSGGVLLPE